MHKDVYIEVIADPFHIDHRMLEFIFSVKDPERIMIISDAVKETKTSPSGSSGIKNEEDALLGGSETVRESSDRLIKTGLDEDIIVKAVSENPARYLQLDQ
jgi:N-acetylglucosamine-6-phosphate deacetylase